MKERIEITRSMLAYAKAQNETFEQFLNRYYKFNPSTDILTEGIRNGETYWIIER